MTGPDPRWTDADGTPVDEEDRGLGHDLRTLVGRRRALGLFGGVSAAALLAACGGSGSTAATTPSSSSGASAGGAPSASDPSGAASSGGITEVPDETGGPFPGDGSNGIDVLDDSGIVRRDVRSSFGASTTTAAGIPLTVRLTVRDAASGDVVSGAGVYVWHCDREGRYSLYSSGAENENYLRGVQQVDDTGTATFTTIFPGCYAGRWPHIHFEVYGSLADATGSGPIVKTSQIALPKESCDVVYASAGYEQSVSNLSRTSLARDNVFGDDGGIHQIASMSGDAAAGYTAALTIGV
jgi:protocatechuate 3,4-dioxygenase beta subunit